jgi:hypothetical protein
MGNVWVVPLLHSEIDISVIVTELRKVLRPIHTYHAAPLPCSDSAVFFVKVHVLAGNIRTASPTV